MTKLNEIPGVSGIDGKTTVLTKAGWKSYSEVKEGDLVLTLNHEANKSEWQPILKMNMFAGDHEMISFESRTHSSFTTPSHKWAVVRSPDSRGWGNPNDRRLWRVSGIITEDDRIPISTICNDLPKEPIYSDSLIELAAWFYTEGHIVKLRDKTNSRSVIISQSSRVNQDKCEMIKASLTEAFGDFSSFPRRGLSKTPDIPRWYESKCRQNNGCISYVLNAEAGGMLQSIIPNKVPPFEFLLSLTQKQLDLFIKVSVLADGHSRPTSRDITFGQKLPEVSEAFQFACILAGHATSCRLGPMNYKGYRMLGVRVREMKYVKPARGVREAVKYNGIVWNLSTANGTCLVSRDGAVYFTGCEPQPVTPLK